MTIADKDAKVGNLLKNIINSGGYQMTDVNDVTIEMVANKLKNAFKRIKGIWDENNKGVRKIEKKMEKFNEQLFELKEERENLENELEGLRSTYETFCEQTGQHFDLN
ncbi:MAG: hypothetical protein K8T10_10140 [Candidatus Eremiobacteraeota bacterium]|nr:hypothetical protein [Candidatus Eremiobacteraeota bacterium]